MKDGKFKDLLVEAYNKSKEGNLVGIAYGAISTYGFSNIVDINGFVEVSNPNMLYLKSRLTENTLDIYSWELENFTVKHSENTIYVKVRNKPEIAFMY